MGSRKGKNQEETEGGSKKLNQSGTSDRQVKQGLFRKETEIKRRAGTIAGGTGPQCRWEKVLRVVWVQRKKRHTEVTERRAKRLPLKVSSYGGAELRKENGFGIV